MVWFHWAWFGLAFFGLIWLHLVLFDYLISCDLTRPDYKVLNGYIFMALFPFGSLIVALDLIQGCFPFSTFSLVLSELIFSDLV